MMIGIREIIDSTASKIKGIYPDIKIYEVIPRQSNSTEAFRVECNVISQINSSNIYYEAGYMIRIAYFKSDSNLKRINKVLNDIRFKFIGDLLIVDSDGGKNYKQIENLNTRNLDGYTGELTFTIQTSDQFSDPEVDEYGDDYDIANFLHNKEAIDV